MKRLAIIVILLSIIPAAVLGMAASGIPSKFNIPWGNSAGSSYIRTIPQASQIGIQNCAASLTDGFPPLSFTPASVGGCPPFGQDFNGIFNQLTAWVRWLTAGGPITWDSTFNTQIGGYPRGAIVQSNILFGRLWLNTTDNNTTNPDDQTGAAANWISLPGTNQPGAIVETLSTTPAPNTVIGNGLTVGNASSNATARHNADTFWLFSFLWINCSGCQLYNSAGGSISRGATAVADWAANDAIATINFNGTNVITADSQTGTTSSLLNNAPVVSGNRTTPGSILGENTHALTLTETPTGITSSQNNTINVTGNITVTGTTTVSGSVSGSGQIPISSGGISSLQTQAAATANITPANISGNWVGASSLSGSMFGSNSMAGNNSMSGNNMISVTSNNTGGGAHNIVERSIVVYRSLAL